MDDHLGSAKHDPARRDGGNSRNGTRTKQLLTDVGPVEVAIPRDRDGSFEPQIVGKPQRRLSEIDGLVILLSAKGLTHGEIAAHLAEVYDAPVSKQTISTITDRVIEGMSEWQNRPLDPVYPVVFIDAINVKVRDGNVANRPIYIALGVTVDGTRDVLGLWAGEHGDGEGSKYWLRVPSEIKNRGTQDVCIVVCDGLKGLPTAIESVWPQAITQTCVIHLLRNSFRYLEEGLGRDRQRPQTGLHRGQRVRSVGRVRRVQRDLGRAVSGDHQAVGERVGRVHPVPGIRQGNPQRDLYDQQHRKPELEDPQGGERPRPLPIEQAALKCVYLAIMSIDPTGKGRKRWVSRWKAPLNAFELAFPGRLITSRN
jgi:transposase-like protein